MRSAAFVLAVTAAATGVGCNSILGIEDPTLGDGDGGADADPDAPFQPNVTGSSIVSYFGGGDAPVEVPEDLSTYTVAAYVPDPGEASGFRIIEGSGEEDGTFVIPDVPAGAFYLKIIATAGTPTYYVTDQRVLDYGFETLGRPDAEPTTLLTPVTFEVDQMTPAEGGYQDVWLDVFQTGTEGFPPFEPVAGTTTLDVPYDWTEGYSYAGLPFLPDAEAGDVLTISVLGSTTGTNSEGEEFSYSYLRDFAEVETTLENGDPATITGSFDQVVTGLRQTFTIDSDDFLSAWEPAPSFSNGVSLSVGIYTDPTQGRGLIWGPPLLQVSASQTPGAITYTNIPYGNPFDADWDRTLEAFSFATRRVRRPDANNPVSIQYFMNTTIPATTTATLEPSASPPKNIMLDDVDAFPGGAVAFDGVAPVRVSWDADEDATRYIVSVDRVAIVSGNFAQRIRAMSVVTTATEALLPAEALTRGEFYTVRVSALADEIDYAGGRLRGTTFLGDSATNATGLYRFDASCGDGDLDEGEQCDGFDETCDPDCSMAECGDGLLNIDAEVCDLGPFASPTAECDPDCTAPVCGDGVYNEAAGEQCDDGDDDDTGNGCTGDCNYYGVCGNGVSEWLEECDVAGETAFCDGDCTEAYCQDGYHNPLAGEQCDDGNYEDGDACDSDCMLPP